MKKYIVIYNTNGLEYIVRWNCKSRDEFNARLEKARAREKMRGHAFPVHVFEVDRIPSKTGEGIQWCTPLYDYERSSWTPVGVEVGGKEVKVLASYWI